MPTQRPELIEGEIYHIVLRGIEGRDIFLDESDFFRGIFSLFEFNTTSLITIRERRKEREEFKKILKQVISRGRTPDIAGYVRDPLVEILAFCLMPNHIHLLLRQLKLSGISKFLQKFGTGYAGYFNKKYNRVGHLFQGRFKIIHIKTNDQLKNVFVYIHTNPIALVAPNWKDMGIKNPGQAKRFLKKYRWSSYLDYIGKKNFPSVTEREFLLKVMGGKEECKKFVDYWIEYKGDIAPFEDVVLE